MGDGLLPIISNIYTIVIKIFVQWFGNLWVPRKKKKKRISGVAGIKLVTVRLCWTFRSHPFCLSGSVTLKKKNNCFRVELKTAVNVLLQF